MNALPVSIARADDCAPIVKAADRALQDQDKVISLKTRQIEVQDNIIKAQDTRIAKLESDGSNIFKSPTFYLVLGLVVGGALVQRASK
jgi:hypothetical protein